MINNPCNHLLATLNQLAVTWASIAGAVAQFIVAQQQVTVGQQKEYQHDDGDTGLIMATARPKLKKPPLYKVIMLNDDYTPMEFVVHILQKFFVMDFDKATQIMLTIHTAGSAVCGTYSRDVAETKSAVVNDYARENQHPLLSTVEVDN